MPILSQPIPRAVSRRQVLSDGRWRGIHGIGRFASEVLRRLPEHTVLENGPRPLSPLDPVWLTCNVLARRPAVFFSPGFNPPPVCPSPFVFTIHDLIQVQAPDAATLTKQFYYELILRPAARRAYRVLSVSEYSRRQIIEWSGVPEEHVVNVGNGVGPPFQADGDRYEPGFPYILYVGNFRPHKNLHRLLRAFQGLDCPELRLLLTGNPTPPILARVQQLGLLSRTEFLGTLSDNDLSSVYRGALFLVLPSLIEGFGLPALEAMACGTPVIVSNRTALPEIAGGAALLVDPLDVCDIRQAMERMLSDSELRTTKRSAGTRRAVHYSWDQVAARVHSVISGALGTGK
ncbi:MAG TPA: glycosyltransferase family 1 protein [Bryobacteraceae bacterium]|nr:glycosyltransferase family 1 protein [Bryobacteraceae bacterium]